MVLKLGCVLLLLRGCSCLMPESGDNIPPSSNSWPGCTCKWIEAISALGKKMKINADGFQCMGAIAWPEKFAGDDCCCCSKDCLRANRCTVAQCADMGIDIGQEELDFQFLPGPRVHNALYSVCSKKYASKRWAEMECLNDPDCEWIQDTDCDDKDWRHCKKVDQQVSGDEQSCTLNKKWTPGPQVGNSLYSTKCSNTLYGGLSWAQTTCEEDPGCDWIHDYESDGNHWRFCKGKADMATGDEKADTMFKTLGDGFIRLKDKRYANAALSVEPGGNKDKGKVWMWSVVKGKQDEWQTWDIRADGTIRLKAYPEFGLSMEEGGCRNSGGVHMAKINEGDSLSMNMVWLIKDGLIRPKAFDKCALAMQANNHRDRGRVWMYTINKDVWQTWGGLPKAIPQGPTKKKASSLAQKPTKKKGSSPPPKGKPTLPAPPESSADSEDAEDPKDADQEQETDPKKLRLLINWKATGCPSLPPSSWTRWSEYLTMKDSEVWNDHMQFCVLKDKKHRAACCNGRSCTPKCIKQKAWVDTDGVDGSKNSTKVEKKDGKKDKKKDALLNLV